MTDNQFKMFIEMMKEIDRTLSYICLMLFGLFVVAGIALLVFT